ncbi:MAG: hypothetical protein WCH05_10380 [Chlorobiaceae bacterium]
MKNREEANGTARHAPGRLALSLALKFVMMALSALSLEFFAVGPTEAKIKNNTSSFTMSTLPLTLQAISPSSELAPQPTGGYSPVSVSMDWSGGSPTMTLEATNTYGSTSCTRTIDNLWTWTFTLTDSTRPSVTTEYAVTGANGAAGVFSNSLDPTSTIAVTITKAGAVPTNVGPARNNDWSLTESINISFTFTNIKRSGTYSGTIQATITPTNFQ